jgi:hypothetical protein
MMNSIHSGKSAIISICEGVPMFVKGVSGNPLGRPKNKPDTNRLSKLNCSEGIENIRLSKELTERLSFEQEGAGNRIVSSNHQ